MPSKQLIISWTPVNRWYVKSLGSNYLPRTQPQPSMEALTVSPCRLVELEIYRVVQKNVDHYMQSVNVICIKCCSAMVSFLQNVDVRDRIWRR